MASGNADRLYPHRLPLNHSLSDLLTRLRDHGPYKTLPSPRRIRVIFNKTLIVDTTRAVLVWEHEWYPWHYIPAAEIQNASLTTNDALATLTVAEKPGVDAKSTDVIRFDGDDSSWGPLAGLVKLQFTAMDSWLEEDLPIFGHPKDPFKRIDILPSTRPIEVRIAGKTVARSSYAQHLHETSLRVRYYLPLASVVDPAILRPSTTTTYCPYKGTAEYYDVVLDGQEYKDYVWWYRATLHESAAIAGLISFYNEKVEIFLDGNKVE
ncbi:DUF427-domain-containing protein [Trichoderma citrinoviride]|uniref:DUF427-domain-containing protein n=1 Tax=Trichoderma citrinoviride TaxID=58853 RepID=A0A2T4B1D5_9HYPO|nr:DUF427-domain-containing protein [Trichoderma citrinoviride]PTB63124.1 DUF427-domain-containing protein [Trichoderma citrinoviride]